MQRGLVGHRGARAAETAPFLLTARRAPLGNRKNAEGVGKDRCHRERQQRGEGKAASGRGPPRLLPWRAFPWAYCTRPASIRVV